jgi:hypothetical protein
MSEWNGQLPQGWLELPIAEVANVSLGKTPKKSHYANEGTVRLIKFRDVMENGLDLSETKDAFVRDEPAAIKGLRPVQKGDVLLTASAHSPEYIGRKIAIISELPEGFDYFYVGELLNIRPYDGVDSRWIAAYLHTEQGYKNIQAHVHGMHLTNGRAQNIPVRIAPPKYMQRAVQTIEALQERSRRAREALSEVGPLLEQFRQSVLAAAFRGDLTADWRAAHPNVEPASELLHRIRTERRCRWEQAELAKYEAKGTKLPQNWQDRYKEPEPVDDSDLPELPAGWTWCQLGLLGDDPLNTVQTGPFGAQLHRAEFTTEGVPVIAVGNLTGIGFTKEGLYFITEKKAKQLRRYDVQAGDLLFARSGATLGKVCIAPSYVNDWRMTGHILRARLNRTFVLPEIVAFALWGDPAVKSNVTHQIRGMTRPGYNTSLLQSIPIPIPPIGEQNEYWLWCPKHFQAWIT